VNGDDLIDRYGRALAGRTGHAVVSAQDERREEVVLRQGRVESTVRTDEAGVVVALDDTGRTVHVATDARSDPAAVVARATRALQHLPQRATEATPARGQAPLVVEPPQPDDALADRTTALLADVAPLLDAHVELRVATTRRRISYLGGDRRGAYTTTRAGVVLRCTRSTGAGTTHLARSGLAAGTWAARALLSSRLVPKMQDELSLPESTADGFRWPELVVVDGEVAAQLVGLLSKSLSAESVHQARSRLASRLDEQVASACLSVVDDPTLTDGPSYGAFDAEGTPTRRKRLVDGGVLRGFLGTAELARLVPATAAGNAWQSNRVSPPRPNGSNLFVEPGPAALPADASTVRIVQSHGLHMANDITGAFSLGATVIVGTAGARRLVHGVTVAGNVLDLLGHVHAVGDELDWSSGSVASYGSPDLLVSGLAIGA